MAAEPILALRIFVPLFWFAFPCGSAVAQTYSPPASSASLLAKLDVSHALPLDEDYRLQFVDCDGSGVSGKRNSFRGHSVVRPNQPADRQHYLCSADPSNVRALLKLPDGGVYWQSKMALDVDGSWVAWEGTPGATDQKETSYNWPGVAPENSREAQIDPDRFPFIVIPAEGLQQLTGAESWGLAKEFASITGLKMGDMGVVVYHGRWTPVFVGDGGPFMKLGEGSARVFEGIGQTRCKEWNADKTRCVGPGHGRYPYRNSGLSKDVIFIVWPNTAKADMGPENAMQTICEFAKEKLGAADSPNCPH
jgi:hypothetical protein